MIEMNVYQKTLVRDVYVVVLEQACAHGSAAAQGPIFWGPKISKLSFYIDYRHVCHSLITKHSQLNYCTVQPCILISRSLLVRFLQTVLLLCFLRVFSILIGAAHFFLFSTSSILICVAHFYFVFSNFFLFCLYLWYKYLIIYFISIK
jgi:hypothetical protein